MTNDTTGASLRMIPSHAHLSEQELHRFLARLDTRLEERIAERLAAPAVETRRKLPGWPARIALGAGMVVAALALAAPWGHTRHGDIEARPTWTDSKDGHIISSAQRPLPPFAPGKPEPPIPPKRP